MTKFITKPQAIPEHFTNINNTNYTNNLTTTNDTNFTLCMTKQKASTSARTSGLASLPRPAGSPGEVIVFGEVMPEEVLPAGWRGVKLDLFDNGVRGSGKRSLKLKLGIIKSDGTTQSLIALMNSPVSYVWRQVADTDRSNAHWTAVRTIQDTLESHAINYRISKCSTPNKGGSTEIVAILVEGSVGWSVSIIREGQQYEYAILHDGPITAAQRAGNIIATKFVGQNHRPLLTARELGI